VPCPLASPSRFSRSIQVDHRHCRPAANETMLRLRRAVGTEVVHWLGANKPAYKLDPGFLEHPRLSPRAVIGPGARFLDFLFTGAQRRRRSPDVEPRSRYRREFAAWPEQVSFFLVDHRHCRPAANETMLRLRRAVGTEVVHWLGANKPAYKLDPGFLEHPRLSPRAVIGPGARFLDFLFTGAQRRRRSPDVEPRSRYRREFAAWPEQVSFFLEPG
jgi:hypothetical protein